MVVLDDMLCTWKSGVRKYNSRSISSDVGKNIACLKEIPVSTSGEESEAMKSTKLVHLNLNAMSGISILH